MTVDEIRELIKLAAETGVAELEVQRGENRVRIRRAAFAAAGDRAGAAILRRIRVAHRAGPRGSRRRARRPKTSPPRQTRRQPDAGEIAHRRHLL